MSKNSKGWPNGSRSITSCEKSASSEAYELVYVVLAPSLSACESASANEPAPEVATAATS